MNTLKLIKISKLVHEILIDDERARNSDSYLYSKVLYKIGQLKNIDVNALSITYFMEHRNKLGFPSYETVSRARRKVQEKHPELAGTDDVETQRIINERVYRDYARNKRIEE